MGMGWEADKRWSNKFLPEIKSILGQLLLVEPSVEEDQERNTDLIVIKMETIRIACRVRRYDVYEKEEYRKQFTIRIGRPSGIKTELTKIIEGWGDYNFYGISDKEEKRLIHWILGNLNAFRIWHQRECLKNGKPPGIEKSNHDGSSEFRAYNYEEIDNFLIAHSNNNHIYDHALTDVSGQTLIPFTPGEF